MAAITLPSDPVDLVTPPGLLSAAPLIEAKNVELFYGSSRA